VFRSSRNPHPHELPARWPCRRLVRRLGFRRQSLPALRPALYRLRDRPHDGRPRPRSHRRLAAVSCRRLVMTAGTDKPGFATRPADPDSWIKAGDAPPQRTDAAGAYSARLTVDITPALR